MEDGSDLPIALRRTRRSLQCSKQAPCVSPGRPAQETPAVRTPKSRKRRVRFSDPGPDLSGTGDGPPTGLTPMVRRTSLSGSHTPRRRSTPARLFPANGSGIPDMDSQGSPFGGEVHFLPLRQVLDGRVKRRIRRNGLSEEMNTISTERRRRAEETKAEIERLKAELAEKDEEIERLHDETVVLDTERVWDLEQQVESLKRELASRSGVQQLPSSPAYEWTRAARDPYSDDFMELDMEDDDGVFGEATRAELVCSTPTRRMRASFPTPPATSPEPQLPQTPCRRVLDTPRSSVGVQASVPDPEKRQLEEELDSLRLEVDKLTGTLESYSALTSRLSDKLAPLSTRSPSEEPSAEDPDLEAHLATVLQTLSDRTAALAELDSSLKNLGFPGSDAFEVIDSLRSGFRSARLELEYLTPGEIPLPLTGSGADVLNLLLTQLRALATANRAADDSIDEYHALELSLRQQLSTRVTAMDTLATQLSAADRAAGEKDARVAELEVGLDRLKSAVRASTRDIAELEALVERMETELTQARADHDETTADLSNKSVTISSLEEKLAAALAETEALQSELTALSTAHADTVASHREEVATLTQAHGAALAQRDARVAELRAEVERVGGALREARESVQRLRVESASERRRAEEVVAGMRGELERAVRMGEGFLGIGATAGVGTGEGEVERRTKRRRYDSGLGFLDEEEVDETDV
ncbi:hypothetical protein C8A01DRAFT_15994 [Parachaetomium inaequale]|uniref:Uncharacterized protein n=1 Tax=Parachaetomium inaequale TaxID=2588326 RepID=A0AAN6SRZ5_9PEZI|nr:hypothetical protein C8A01DRAFT_15994 [Parachaetomium inaequale]